MSHRRAGAAIVAALSLAGLAPAAHADGPGVGTPTVATLGDSYISGEAGRWAGNIERQLVVDRRARLDGVLRQRVEHRRDDLRLPSVEVGGGVHRRRRQRRELRLLRREDGVSLGSSWKPGLDFYDDGAGHVGRRKLLQSYAATHNIAGGHLDRRERLQLRLRRPDLRAGLAALAVVVEGLLQRRLVGDVELHRFERRRAAGQDQERDPQRPPAMATRATATRSTRSPCRTTSRRSPTARASVTAVGLHPAEHGRLRVLERRRQLGQRDRAAHDQRRREGRGRGHRPVNIRILELQSAFNGRRLCENTVGLLEEKGLSSWTNAGAVDRTEWVNQIRTVSTVFGPYKVQESLHPNYWGQLALRNCVRQAYNGGAPRGGTCTIAGTGLTSRGEPNMVLN